MANWILFGFLCVQICTWNPGINLYTSLNSLQDFYYMAFPNDRLILKLVVFLELMLETVQTVAVTHDVFVFFTTDPLVINQIGSSSVLYPSVNRPECVGAAYLHFISARWHA